MKFRFFYIYVPKCAEVVRPIPAGEKGNNMHGGLEAGGHTLCSLDLAKGPAAEMVTGTEVRGEAGLQA